MKKSADEFEKFMKELQEEIHQGETRTFSEKVLEEYHHPKNWGKIQNPDTHAIIKGPCGDTMHLYLKIEKGVITQASFFTDGCGPTVACGSKLTTLVINRPLNEIEKITTKDLLEALDGLPPENEHCALLAVNTLQKALNQFISFH